MDETDLIALIGEQAKEEANKNVTDYAPYSFKAGFIEGAKWMLKTLRQ